MKKIIQLFAICIALISLSSCYINTAEHIWSLGGYDAIYQPQAQGACVLEYKDKFYVKMRRLKEPITTHYRMDEQQSGKPALEDTGEVDVFKIDPLYAAYLLGDDTLGPTKLTRVTDEDEADEILSRSTKHPIERTIPTHKEHWTSGGVAPVWYSLAVLDWLCIDFPASIVESTLAIYYWAATEGVFEFLKAFR